MKMKLLSKTQQNIKSTYSSADITKKNGYKTKIGLISVYSKKNNKPQQSSAFHQQIHKDYVSIQCRKVRKNESNDQLKKINSYIRKGRAQYYPQKVKRQQERTGQIKSTRKNLNRYLSLLRLDQYREKQNKINKNLQINELNVNLMKYFDKKAKHIAEAQLSLLIPKLKINKPNHGRQLRQTTQFRSNKSLNCTVVNILATVIKNKVEPIHNVYGKSSHLNSVLQLTPHNQNNQLLEQRQQKQISFSKKTHKRIMYSSKISITEHIPLKKRKIKKLLFNDSSNQYSHTKNQTKTPEDFIAEKIQEKQIKPWSTQQISWNQ